MKRYTYKQIHSAFIEALKKDWGNAEVIKDIANAPCHTTVINISASFQLKYGNGHEHFEFPINIMVKGSNIEKAIYMEIATQLYQFGELEYYDDNFKPLEFSDIFIATYKIISTEQGRYAIFHREQECGCSWLEFTLEEITAPFIYQENYRTNSLKRSESNRLNKYPVSKRH